MKVLRRPSFRGSNARLKAIARRASLSHSVPMRAQTLSSPPVPGLQRFGFGFASLRLASPRLVTPVHDSHRKQPLARRATVFALHNPPLSCSCSNDKPSYECGWMALWLSGSPALRRLCTVAKTSVHLLSRKESERKSKGEPDERHGYLLSPRTRKCRRFRRTKAAARRRDPPPRGTKLRVARETKPVHRVRNAKRKTEPMDRPRDAYSRGGNLHFPFSRDTFRWFRQKAVAWTHGQLREQDDARLSRGFGKLCLRFGNVKDEFR